MKIDKSQTQVESSQEVTSITVNKESVKKLSRILTRNIYNNDSSFVRESFLNARESVHKKAEAQGSYSKNNRGQDATLVTEVILPDFAGSWEVDPANEDDILNVFSRNFSGDKEIFDINSTKEIHVIKEGYSHNTFSIRDYGVGMSADDFSELILSLGASSKSEDNTYGGGMGIGSFSAFSVTDKINYDCFKDGLRNSYSIVDFGDSVIQYIHDEPTDEPDGVRMSCDIDFRTSRDGVEIGVSEAIIKYENFITGSLDYLISLSDYNESIKVAIPELFKNFHKQYTSDNIVKSKSIIDINGTYALEYYLPPKGDNLIDLSSVGYNSLARKVQLPIASGYKYNHMSDNVEISTLMNSKEYDFAYSMSGNFSHMGHFYSEYGFYYGRNGNTKDLDFDSVLFGSPNRFIPVLIDGCYYTGISPKPIYDCLLDLVKDERVKKFLRQLGNQDMSNSLIYINSINHAISVPVGYFNVEKEMNPSRESVNLSINDVNKWCEKFIENITDIIDSIDSVRSFLLQKKDEIKDKTGFKFDNEFEVAQYNLSLYEHLNDMLEIDKLEIINTLNSLCFLNKEKYLDFSYGNNIIEIIAFADIALSGASGNRIGKNESLFQNLTIERVFNNTEREYFKNNRNHIQIGKGKIDNLLGFSNSSISLALHNYVVVENRNGEHINAISMPIIAKEIDFYELLGNSHYFNDISNHRIYDYSDEEGLEPRGNIKSYEVILGTDSSGEYAIGLERDMLTRKNYKSYREPLKKIPSLIVWKMTEEDKKELSMHRVLACYGENYKEKALENHKDNIESLTKETKDSEKYKKLVKSSKNNHIAQSIIEQIEGKDSHVVIFPSLNSEKFSVSDSDNSITFHNDFSHSELFSAPYVEIDTHGAYISSQYHIRRVSDIAVGKTPNKKKNLGAKYNYHFFSRNDSVLQEKSGVVSEVIVKKPHSSYKDYNVVVVKDMSMQLPENVENNIPQYYIDNFGESIRMSSNGGHDKSIWFNIPLIIHEMMLELNAKDTIIISFPSSSMSENALEKVLKENLYSDFSIYENLFEYIDNLLFSNDEQTIQNMVEKSLSCLSYAEIANKFNRNRDGIFNGNFYYKDDVNSVTSSTATIKEILELSQKSIETMFSSNGYSFDEKLDRDPLAGIIMMLSLIEHKEPNISDKEKQRKISEIVNGLSNINSHTINTLIDSKIYIRSRRLNESEIKYCHNIDSGGLLFILLSHYMRTKKVYSNKEIDGIFFQSDIYSKMGMNKNIQEFVELITMEGYSIYQDMYQATINSYGSDTLLAQKDLRKAAMSALINLNK